MKQIAFLFASGVFARYVNSICDRTAEQSWVYTAKSLPDIGHSLLPHLSKYYQWNDFPVFLLGLYALLRLREKHQLIKKMSIIWVLRAITCVSTILPSSFTNEMRQNPSTILHLNSAKFDSIFSGHAAFYCLVFRLFWKQDPHHAKIKFLFLFSVFSSLFAIASRFHYTVDVVLAWIIGYLI